MKAAVKVDCRVHGYKLIYQSSAPSRPGLCVECLDTLKALLNDEDAEYRRAVEVRLAAIRGCEHTVRVPGCPGVCGRFA